MEFESILKVIVMGVAAVGIPVGAYAAIAATRSLWGRPGDPGSDQLRAAAGADLIARQEQVRDLEVLQARMAELEERLDFAERMLIQQRETGRLPDGTEVR
jgi:hypothetical protein